MKLLACITLLVCFVAAFHAPHPFLANVPHVTGNFDWYAFYAGGKMDGNLYDLASHNGVQFVSPPWVAVLFAWVKPFTAQQAFALWTLASGVMLFYVFVLFKRMGITTDDERLTVLAILLFPGVLYNFNQGQLSIVVLLAVVGAMYLLWKQQPLAAGLVLSLGLVKFHLLIPFVVVFLLRRQWRTLLGLAISGFFALAASFAVLGKTVLTYPAAVSAYQLAQCVTSGRGYPNVRGLLFCLFGYRMPVSLSLLLIAAASVLIAYFWRDDVRGMALLSAVAVITADHTSACDMLLFLPLLALALPIRWNSWQGVTFVLLATPVFHLLAFVSRGFWIAVPLVLVNLSHATAHSPVSLANTQAPPAPTETEIVMVDEYEYEETAP